MRRYKLAGLCLFFTILLICDWHISNLPLLTMREETVILEEDLFLSLFDSINGYAGILQLLVIYPLVLLLCIFFFTGKELPAYLIRFQKRSRWRWEELKRGAAVAGLFSVIHELVSAGFAHLHFETDLIKAFPFTEYTFLTIGVLFLFYMQVGIVCFLLSDLLKKKVRALLITFFLYLAQYWICKFQLLSCWLPYQDLLSMFEFLMGTFGYGDMLRVLIRNILLDGILIYLCQRTFERKDLMEDGEK